MRKLRHRKVKPHDHGDIQKIKPLWSGSLKMTYLSSCRDMLGGKVECWGWDKRSGRGLR